MAREGMARTRAIALAGGTAMAAALAAPGIQAADFRLGDIDGSLDTTISVGLSFRAADRDAGLIGRANGGEAYSINGDDGNLNYDRGLIAAAGRATHELELEDDGFGIFTRVSYFYDPYNAGKNHEFRELSDKADGQVASDFDILDAFVFGGLEAGDVPIDFKFGNHVLSWGESTFVRNGINVVNPVDVSAIRVPGSEIRNALEPVPMISANAGLTNNLSVEGFYQLWWEPTEIDAAGTYFSTNDFASPGGETLFLGFGQTPPAGPPDNATAALAVPNGGAGSGNFGAAVPRGPDIEARNQGQFGLAARYYAEDLNATEFGAYFLNYHSRVPVISADPSDNPADLTPGATPSYFANSTYFTEYPEDIQLFGLSFNTQVGSVSLAGEASWRKDQPLQVDDVELLAAAQGIATVNQACAAGAAACAAAANAVNQLDNQVLSDLGIDQPGEYVDAFGDTLRGYREEDVFQAQITASNAFGPIESVGVDQWLLIGEVGVTHIPGLPDSDSLRFDGPNTPLPGGAAAALAASVPQQDGGFATKTSWGYQVRARFDMLNAFGTPVNLFPSVAFSHDVHGTTPAPLNTFVENRAALTFGIEATYLERWSAGLSYTNFFSIGDDEHNVLRDRDFVSLNVKYSF
ncbi:MAG: DUF1302 domain-containing protein [Azospirillaceae bacterium]